MSDLEQAARAEAERRYPLDQAHGSPGLVFAEREWFVRGASWLAEYLLSDESVERHARYTYEKILGWHDWDVEGKRIKDGYRKNSRAALAAALGERQLREIEEKKAS